jgi:N-hydroxyarylamine O-acetyltransferase
MALDLKRYLARIDYSGELKPTVATLRELHLAHATHIPFENLDVLLRRPIRLDLDSITAKLIHANRGGYCFEHNSLFAAVLEQIGFHITRLAGRVRMGASATRPRTHMALAVTAEGEQWLADVGFGLEGLLYPVAIQLDEPVNHFAWRYRIVAEGRSFVLQSFHRVDDAPECTLQAAHLDGWLSLYSFTLDDEIAGDYEMANYFISTYPRSPMVRVLLAQWPGIETRVMMRNRLLVERTPDGGSVTELTGDEAILAVLSERFGLHFPAGTRFPFDPAV